MKTAKGCKDVSSMSPQDEQYNRMQSNHKQKNSRRKFLRITAFSAESNNYSKGDIEFVTEFPCLLGHPVYIG